MSGTRAYLPSCLSLLLMGLLAGCASGAHSTASRPREADPPAYWAQAAFVDCKNSMECCIKKFPATAAQSCGATVEEIASVLNGARVLNEATQAEEAASERKDRTPEWKQECIEKYNQCIDDDWVGTWSCVDCLRYCEGQRRWPADRCFKAAN